jgi:hypothetical protein
MSAERAIHEHWSLYRPLASLVPPEQIYTGLPPIRQTDGSPLQFPYVSLTLRGESQIQRTASGSVISNQRLRFAVYSRSYEQARTIERRIVAYFNRRDFTWSGGRVLDMRPDDRNESEDAADGVWMVARDFQVRVADNSSGVFA